MDRLDALEVLAHARAAAGDLEAAGDAAGALARLAEAVLTGPIMGAARFAAGAAEAARGHHAKAREALEEAVDRYERSGAPFEAARARLQLSRCLAEIGLTAVAAEEARRASSAFEALGAARWAEVAERLVAATSDGSGRRRSDVPLTSPEIEVLRLMEQALKSPPMAAAVEDSQAFLDMEKTRMIRVLEKVVL